MEASTFGGLATVYCRAGRVYERDRPPGRPVSRFEKGRVSRLTHLFFLTARTHPKSLMDVPGKWIDRAAQRRSLDKLILDLNSSVKEPYAHREGRGHRPPKRQSAEGIGAQLQRSGGLSG